MSKVWPVAEGDCDTWHVVAVFSSKELAEAYVEGVGNVSNDGDQPYVASPFDFDPSPPPKADRYLYEIRVYDFDVIDWHRYDYVENQELHPPFEIFGGVFCTVVAADEHDAIAQAKAVYQQFKDDGKLELSDAVRDFVRGISR